MLSPASCERLCPDPNKVYTATNLLGSPVVSEPSQWVTGAMNASQDAQVAVGELFDNKDAIYIIVGTVVGAVQPFVVGKLLEGNAGTAVNVATGVIALGIGVASKAGMINSVSKEVTAGLLGYGITILGMTLINELVRRWG